jgi:DNA-binding SARP family transcriptional activator/TolB-like protein
MGCRLSLFGPPRLLDDQGSLVSVPAKTYALVAYLVLTSDGGPAGRAQLRRFLWEDSDAKTAAANLRKFLSRIVERQAARGFELIRSERDHVELAKSAWIDLTEFLRLATAPSSADLEALCDLYRGELLEGFEAENNDLSAWLRVERTKLRDAFINAVTNQIELIEARGDRIPLRVAARRLISVDPYNEIGHRTLMRLYAEEGEPARVRELYQGLEARLREDLGVSPDEATTELYRSLMPPPQRRPADRNADTVPAAPIVRGGQLVPGDDVVAVPERHGAPRITVLPPLPLGGQDYGHQLAVSLIEDVTIGLCRSKALSVVAPHTAWELSQSGKRSLLREFRIDYAVETHLQNRGGEFVLGVKLVDAMSRSILWMQRYELDKDAIARQYSNLPVRIILTLVDRVERAELARYETQPDPTAYQIYLLGQRHARTLDLPSVRRARRHFKAALGACSEFVPAISALGRTYQQEWLLMARGDRELLDEAERLARMSIEVDPDDARGYRELANCALFGGRFDESLTAFAQAEECNPQYADLLADLADALVHSCDAATGLQKISSAIELNPLCPDYYWWTAGGANFHLRRYDDAIACMSRMRDKSPAFRLIAASHAMLGNKEEAAQFVRKTKDIHPDFRVSGWLSILPIRDREYAQHYEQSLREAGFE